MNPIFVDDTGRWWSHRPWRRLRKGCTRHSAPWRRWQGSARPQAGLGDPRALFHPNWGSDSGSKERLPPPALPTGTPLPSLARPAPCPALPWAHARSGRRARPSRRAGPGSATGGAEQPRPGRSRRRRERSGAGRAAPCGCAGRCSRAPSPSRSSTTRASPPRPSPSSSSSTSVSAGAAGWRRVGVAAALPGSGGGGAQAPLLGRGSSGRIGSAARPRRPRRPRAPRWHPAGRGVGAGGQQTAEGPGEPGEPLLPALSPDRGTSGMGIGIGGPDMTFCELGGWRRVNGPQRGNLNLPCRDGLTQSSGMNS